METFKRSLVREVEPDYSPLARQARISGTVVMNAIIGISGSVRIWRLVSGTTLCWWNPPRGEVNKSVSRQEAGWKGARKSTLTLPG